MSDLPEIREGEVALPRDPSLEPDAGVVFIGRIHTPWQRGDCPRNIAMAREAKPDTWIEVKADFVPALAGLDVGQPVMLLYWMHNARRDLVVQAPRHRSGPHGTFALRSPNRPNPVAASTVLITSLDMEAGRVGIDAIDCFDGTPLVDIKPWLPTIDNPPA